MAATDTLNCQRVFKKSSPNNKLTLYLCSRDLVIENGVIDKLQGVLCVDPEILEGKKVFGQVTLTFRYGREDEEVMGLKFCNEAVMCIAQLYPPLLISGRNEPNTPLQDALIQRLGSRARAFSLELTPLAPPSVQLVPAKEYRGAPIGTSYDVRAYIAEGSDAKLDKRTTVRMGIRVVQGGGGGPTGPEGFDTQLTTLKDTRFTRLSPKSYKPGSSPGRRMSAQLRPPVLPEETTPTSGDDQLQDTSFTETNVQSEQKNVLPPLSLPAPYASVDKPFLLSDGRVALEASLDKASYSHGEPVRVNVAVTNSSHKTVRRIKVFVVQHVDVCMFSNGKFKNVVALTTSRDECPVSPGGRMNSSYTLRPARGTTKNWIALEDSYSKNGASLASSVISSSNTSEDRNVFAIYVSYYVKVKLSLSAMGGELSLKLPFTLAHSCRDEEPMSPNANFNLSSPMDEITTECDKIDDFNDKKREKTPFITYKDDDLKVDEVDTMKIENICGDVDGVTSKVIVNIEDRDLNVDEFGKEKLLERASKVQIKSETTRKTVKEEDMNLITSYEDCENGT